MKDNASIISFLILIQVKAFLIIFFIILLNHPTSVILYPRQKILPPLARSSLSSLDTWHIFEIYEVPKNSSTNKNPKLNHDK